MCKLDLVPADELHAWHIKSRSKLFLSAKGQTLNLTYDIRFTPLYDTEMRYPVFRLEGWVEDKTFENLYDITNNFKFQSRPDFVKILTADHPDGIIIRVLDVQGPVVDPGKLPTSSISTLSNSDTSAFPPLKIKDEDNTRFVVFGVPFDIDVAAKIDEEGSITMQHESACLNLDTSGLVKGKLVWTFTPVCTGHTQVIVTVAGGILPYIYRIVFNLFVFFPFGPLPVDPVSKLLPVLDASALEDGSSTALVKSQSSGLGAEAASIDPSDSFGQRFESGLDWIKDNGYQQVTIFFFSGISFANRGVSLIRLLSSYDLGFSAMVKGEPLYIIIRSVTQGAWQSISTSPTPFDGITELDQPVALSADAALATARVRGFSANIRSLKLQKRENASSNQYVFQFADGTSTTVQAVQKGLQPSAEEAGNAVSSTKAILGSANGTTTIGYNPGNQLVSVAA